MKASVWPWAARRYTVPVVSEVPVSVFASRSKPVIRRSATTSVRVSVGPTTSTRLPWRRSHGLVCSLPSRKRWKPPWPSSSMRSHGYVALVLGVTVRSVIVTVTGPPKPEPEIWSWSMYA